MSGQRIPRMTRRERERLMNPGGWRTAVGRHFSGGTNRRADLAAKLLGPPVHAKSGRRIHRRRRFA